MTYRDFVAAALGRAEREKWENEQGDLLDSVVRELQLFPVRSARQRKAYNTIVKVQISR